MQGSQIIAVKINDISAELEISQNAIKCVTGDTVHFEISYENISTFLHTRANKILLNFVQNDETIPDHNHIKTLLEYHKMFGRNINHSKLNILLFSVIIFTLFPEMDGVIVTSSFIGKSKMQLNYSLL